MERADFPSVYLDQEYSLVCNQCSVLEQPKPSTAGTVIAISHDKEFLKETGIEREIYLGN